MGFKGSRVRISAARPLSISTAAWGSSESPRPFHFRDAPRGARKMADYQNPILIVDDDSLILETVTDVLRMEGFNTIGTTDSLSVPSILEANPVEIVITDVNMPNRDGLQLLDDINELEKRLKRHFLVIVLTGTG